MTAVDFDGRRPVVEGQDHAQRVAERARSDRARRGAEGTSGTPLTDTDHRLISEAAFVIGDAIALLQMTGHRIPRRWPRLLDALNRSLSADGHQTCRTGSAPARLETTAEQAQRLGVSERTIRRRAARQGVNRTAGRYLFERPDP